MQLVANDWVTKRIGWEMLSFPCVWQLRIFCKISLVSPESRGTGYEMSPFPFMKSVIAMHCLITLIFD